MPQRTQQDTRLHISTTTPLNLGYGSVDTCDYLLLHLSQDLKNPKTGYLQ